VLSIAVCTYLILADYKHQSSWIQEHRYLIWILPWVLSTLWAVIGLAVTGYGDIGAWCWFTSDTVRLLVNFIPRWLIIISILGLYLRLYFIIHKAHTRFMSFDEDGTGGSMQMTGSRVTPQLSRHGYSPNPSSNNNSSGRSDDCERGPVPPPVHARIGRAPHLKRVRPSHLSLA